MNNISLFIYSFTVVYLLTLSGVVAADTQKATVPLKITSITTNIPDQEEPKTTVKSITPNIPDHEEPKTTFIKLNRPITVKGNFSEVRDSLIGTDGGFDLSKLKILMAGYEIKTTASWAGNDEVIFRWDESPGALKEIRDLKANLLIEGNNNATSKVTFKLAYGAQIAEMPINSSVRVWLYNDKLRDWGTVFLGICVVLFLWLAKTSDIIRDTTPPFPPVGTRKPYSLGSFQMALWFFTILGSFLWLWVITDIPSISNTALILMGLSVGTGALAVVVDTNRRQTADNELSVLMPERDKLAATIIELEKLAKLKVVAGQKSNFITLTEAAIVGLKTAGSQNGLDQLIADVTNAKTELKQISVQIAELQPTGDGTVTGDLSNLSNVTIQIAENKAKLDQKEKQIASAVTAQTKPVSQRIDIDILTDINGISFHRFQMLLWTFVLIAVFLEKVWTTFAMPDLDPLLLALTGISGATYIGFKVPERQT